jgi:hypothetical protein
VCDHTQHTHTRQHHRNKGIQPKVARATALEVKNTLQGQQMMFDAISDRFLAWHVMQQAKTCYFFFLCRRILTDFNLLF